MPTQALLAVFMFLAAPLLAFAQATPLEPPAFLKDLNFPIDLGKLTPEQRKELEEYQKNSSIGPYSITPSVSVPEGAVNCFDFYHFGSVQVDVSPNVASTVPGVPITFSGVIKNANSYPIIGGSVYAKVFRKQSDDVLAHQNGHLLVDQFVVKEDITLRANGELPLTFEWNIPRSAVSGEYEVAMFFYTADRFNLLGLTFTDDVVGNKTSFTVKSDMQGEVSFDKNAVTLNGRPFHFAAFQPRFTADEPVKAEVKITNTTAKPQQVALSWKLYNWDSLRADNFMGEKKETLSLKPGETKSLTYETREYKGAVTFLVAEAVANGQKSLLDIRWIREGVSETRINFPGIMKFPLTAGEANSVFACAHSTSQPIVENSELSLVLTDEAGETIHAYTYQGGITGAMMGVKDTFTPKKTFDRFTLTTTLKKDGKVVEALDLRYDCRSIDPSLCSKEGSGMTGIEADILGGSGKSIALLVLAVIVLLLGFLGWKLWKDRSTKTFVFLLGILLSGTMLFGGAGEAEAEKSAVANVNGIPWLAWDWDLSGPYTTDTIPLETDAWGAKWLSALEAGANASVLYRARLIDDSTGLEIADHSVVPVGTTFRVERVPAQDTDISWNGTGYAADTPFGFWVKDAGPLSRACHAEDKTYERLVEKNGVTAPLIAYTLLNVAPKTEQLVSPSANLSCTGNICTVTDVGAVSVSMNFPSTQGRFYYRYLDHPKHFGGGCRGNNTPMRVITGCSNTIVGCGSSAGYDVEPMPYDLPVPEQTITFNLTAGIALGNTAPSAPTVTPHAANNYKTSSLQSFDLQASDPDGDTIRYGIDWNVDGLIDQWIPSAGYVATGTIQPGSYSWPVAGSYDFQVLAQDVNGAFSAWTPYSVTVTDLVAPPNILTICQDSCDSGIRRDSFTNVIGIGETRTYFACYSADADCLNPSGAFSVTWSEGGNSTYSLQGPNPAASIVIRGDATGTETVTADTGSDTATGTIRILAECPKDCSNEPNVCQGIRFDDANHCGTDNCIGTKVCSVDYNWREVSP